MASTSSWMPPPGRHTVNIGSSLGRAIKNRKLKGSPAPTAKRSNLPERDFYSFKFNFKASSVDAAKPATIEIKKGAESTQIRAQYPSTQPGEVHTFNGIETPARDVDCILIYDEDTGQYTLEKLESYVGLKFDRKVAVSPRPTSPVPIATGKGKAKQEDYEIAAAIDEDAEGEVEEDDLEELLQQAIADEPEEGEEIELPPPKPQPPIPKARPVKPLPAPKARAEPPKAKTATPAVVAPPPGLPPKPKAAPAKTKKTAKAQPPTSYPDEEVIEFGKPAKRARPSPPQQPPAPPPRAPSPLSFPGGSTPAFAPPPAPAAAKPAISRNIPARTPPEPVLPPQPTMPPSPQLVQSDSDDDDDDEGYWEQVPTVTPVIPQPQADYEAALEEDIFGDGFGDEGDAGEDIDENDFEKMMNEQMDRDSEDESSMVALSPEPDPTRKPISLNNFASGGVAVDSDDDFSSSEESDED